MSRLRKILSLIGLPLLVLATAPMAVAQEDDVPTSQPVTAAKNVSGQIANTTAKIHGDMGLSEEDGGVSFNQQREKYEKAHGAPILDGYFEIGLSHFFESNTIRYLLWGVVSLFAAFSAAMGMKAALGGSSPVPALATLAAKLLFGAIIIANRSFIYAMLITLVTSLTSTLTVLKNAGVYNDNPSASSQTLEYDKIRNDSVEKETMTYAMAIGQAIQEKDSGLEDEAEDAYNVFVNEIVPAIRKAGGTIEVPAVVIASKSGDDGDGKDAEMRVKYGAWFSQHGGAILKQLALLPRPPTDKSDFAFPQYEESSTKIKEAKASSDPEFHKNNKASYETVLKVEVANYLREEITDKIDDDLVNEGWMSRVGNSISASLNSFSIGGIFRKMADFIVSILGYAQTIVVAVMVFGVTALIEVYLFVLVLMFPFWLHEKTAPAFLSPLRGAVGAALWIPVFQFAMLIVDGIFTSAIKLILMLGTAAGLVTGGSSLAVTGVVLLSFAVAYFIAMAVTLFMTPGWIKIALSGGDVAAGFIMKQATGLAEGAIMAAAVVSGVGAPMVAGKAAAGMAGKATAGVAGKAAAGAAGKTATQATGGKVARTASPATISVGSPAAQRKAPKAPSTASPSLSPTPSPSSPTEAPRISPTTPAPAPATPHAAPAPARETVPAADSASWRDRASKGVSVAKNLGSIVARSTTAQLRSKGIGDWASQHQSIRRQRAADEDMRAEEEHLKRQSESATPASAAPSSSG